MDQLAGTRVFELVLIHEIADYIADEVENGDEEKNQIRRFRPAIAYLQRWQARMITERFW